jgi:hypothetical protein
MPLDVNEDQNGEVTYGSDDLEAFFPGCVIRKNGGFTMNHDRLTTRYIMAVKATTMLTKEEFIAIMERRWDACEVDAVGEPSIQ